MGSIRLQRQDMKHHELSIYLLRTFLRGSNRKVLYLKKIPSFLLPLVHAYT